MYLLTIVRRVPRIVLPYSSARLCSSRTTLEFTTEKKAGLILFYVRDYLILFFLFCRRLPALGFRKKSDDSKRVGWHSDGAGSTFDREGAERSRRYVRRGCCAVFCVWIVRSH